jgi:hypothetical protein
MTDDAIGERNRIRGIIKACFESVTVWGLPSPIYDAIALNKGRYVVDVVTPLHIATEHSGF